MNLGQVLVEPLPTHPLTSTDLGRTTTMGTEITDHAMTSDTTRHSARWSADAAADGRGAWIVSWLPTRLLSRNQAVSAMKLAEHVARQGAAAAADPHVEGWAAELELSADAAVRRCITTA
jgi:hypothetical protein